MGNEVYKGATFLDLRDFFSQAKFAISKFSIQILE
jgi:hypothetical protein